MRQLSPVTANAKMVVAKVNPGAVPPGGELGLDRPYLHQKLVAVGHDTILPALAHRRPDLDRDMRPGGLEFRQQGTCAVGGIPLHRQGLRRVRDTANLIGLSVLRDFGIRGLGRPGAPAPRSEPWQGYGPDVEVRRGNP
jgi:hypothetical protein